MAGTWKRPDGEEQEEGRSWGLPGPVEPGLNVREVPELVSGRTRLEQS